MISCAMDINALFPARKSKKQKQAFREAVGEYIEALGYEPQIEKGSFGAKNVVFGNPETAKYLICAHYDTCAWLPFPNMITPCSLLLYLLSQVLLLGVFYVLSVAVGVLVGVLLCNIPLGIAASYAFWYLMLLLIFLGPANKHNANDNTSGVVTVLEIARTLPENLRDKVCFVLFDLEEAGLIGSSSYRKAHKEQIKEQIMLNLDCVGDGNEIQFFPSKKVKKDPELVQRFEKVCGDFDKKCIRIRKKGFFIYPSDQRGFPYGVGIAAFHRSKWAGLYLGRIHTGRDTVLEETNVNLLRASLTTLVSMDTVK